MRLSAPFSRIRARSVREATADCIRRDLSVRRTAPPFASDSTGRARDTSNRPRRSFLRHGSPHLNLHIQHRSIVFATLYGGPAYSSHSNIYAAFTTRPGCPLFGLTSSTYRSYSQSIPLVTDKVQRPNVVTVAIRVAWHKPHRRVRASASCRLFSG